MLNQVIVVGRIFGEARQVNSKKAIITLAVPRSYKNTNGEYDGEYSVNLSHPYHTPNSGE